MGSKQSDVLDQLTDEEYSAAKQAGASKLEALCKGEIVVNRKKDYLLSLKKELKKALSLNYTYADLAGVLRDESKGIMFSAKQIREFCEENGLTSTKVGTSRKRKGGLNKAVTPSMEEQTENSEAGTSKKHSNDEDIAEI